MYLSVLGNPMFIFSISVISTISDTVNMQQVKKLNESLFDVIRRSCLSWRSINWTRRHAVDQ